MTSRNSRSWSYNCFSCSLYFGVGWSRCCDGLCRCPFKDRHFPQPQGTLPNSSHLQRPIFSGNCSLLKKTTLTKVPKTCRGNLVWSISNLPAHHNWNFSEGSSQLQCSLKLVGVGICGPYLALGIRCSGIVETFTGGNNVRRRQEN